jgi:AcrR family transcriptional regulator
MKRRQRQLPPDHRARLMDGMAAAFAKRSYSETTIADIVRHAGVSKRTFYEHFGAKEECLLALYVAASERVLAAIEAAVATARGLDQQIAAATTAYLARMQAHPQLMRTLLIEILAAGPTGLAVRRDIHQRYAALLRRLVSRTHRRPLSAAMASAVVGGINELILQAVLDDRIDRLLDLAGPAADLVHAVVDAA